MMFDFFKTKHECLHKNVPIDVDEAYCPDCGALIKNKWYLVRCSCCNVKRKAHIEYDNIKPDTKYCHNCGSTEFFVEELDSINFMNVHYAVFKKEIILQNNKTTRQIWIEECDEEQKLISTKR